MLKISFLILVVLHALIHLMGWLKAYSLADLPQFTQTVSRPAGIMWLVSALLFLATAVLFILKKEAWWQLGLAAIVLSQILIILFWQDAKFGTIANGLILIGVLLSFGQWSFNRMVENELTVFLPKEPSKTQIVDEERLLQLPPIVQKWITGSGIMNKKPVQIVHLFQTGEMKTTPGGRWLAVEAEQWYTLDEPGFIWRADVGKGSLMRFAGRDKLEGGEGSMLIKLFSLIKVVNASDENIHQGAALRYLAEMVWFPQAALMPYVTWETSTPLKAGATLHIKNMEVSGEFTFSEKGEVVRFEAPRYYQETGTTETWVIDIDGQSYSSFSGVKLPARATVTWQLPEDNFTWYKVRITEVDFNSDLHLE